ncbi:hypothetical protein [Hymenobacter lapidiphilus]|uniref:Uncharacterized protein n=1 Tax=Hymenobacter lapidiphilus TaxID=2608003 RepID=A0A7Y7U558_9BACT|nr:hypothetical protein [Hymenobacter lapidiphilus]NVO30374.1 hypothetical protein [Hymenobacter lapidiphilus]
MQVNLAELSWEDVKKCIYPADGSLPDTYVLETTRDEWRRWADFVNSNYPVKYFPGDGHEGVEVEINMPAVFKYWDSNDKDDSVPHASIQVGGVRVNCFFLSEDIIDGDIDPRDVRSSIDHDHLMRYLTSISLLLGKRIVLLSEGTQFSTGTPTGFDPEPLLTIDGELVSAHIWWPRLKA